MVQINQSDAQNHTFLKSMAETLPPRHENHPYRLGTGTQYGSVSDRVSYRELCSPLQKKHFQ